MKIGVTGGTGFIGRHFAAAARASGHEVIGFSRQPKPRPEFTEVRAWLPVAAADFRGLEAIVHLAGENIFGLWTKRKKAAIRDSRVNDTCRMLERLRALAARPRVLVSASGSNYYGDRGDEELTEASPAGAGFLAEVCRAWEAAALEAADFTRVVTLRTGMVLGDDGGAAPALRRIFKPGMGGRLGSGRQWTPWIHIHDHVRLILSAVESETLRGPVNAVAPGLVRNADFTRAVARALRRPAWLPAPAFLLRRLPGGMSEMFLHSQRVYPAAAAELRFRFLYPDIHSAAASVFSGTQSS